MRYSHRSRALALCGSISVLAFISPVQAQTTPEEASVQAPEIVVTATRQARLLQEVPMSVNVATGEDLQKLSLFDAKDIQQLSPGLELTNTTGRNNTTTLRGVSFDPDQGTGPAVQVYYNEIPTDAQTVYTALYDIQQVEVLRGPQGLLRGLSAPAGSITIATRKPNFNEPEGYVQATATTRAGYNVQGAVSAPFSDKVALRVSALVDGNRLNNVKNVNRDDQRSRSRTESVRATLGLRPTDTFTAYLTYQYLNADNRQFQQVIGAGNTPNYQAFPYFGGFLLPDTSTRSGPPLSASDYGAVADGLFRNQNNTHLINLSADWDLGPATLSFVGAHQYTVLKIDRDLDSGNAVPNYINNSFVRTPYKVDTAELRLTSNEDEGLGWGVGAFYVRQTGATIVNQKADFFLFPFSVTGFIPAFVPNTANITVPTDARTASFNGNLRYRSGGLSIEGGLRYTIIKSNQTTQLSVNGAPAAEIIPANLQKRTYKPLTGGLTVSYEVMPTMNVYAAYGHSYRAGSVGVAVPNGISSDLILTKPEKTDSFEVGVKGSLADRRINFTIAAFYQKLDNFLSRFTGIFYNAPLNVPQTGGFDFNYNGDAKIKGVEASVDGRVTSNWDFGISAAYAHARYSNALLPCNDYDGSGVPNQNGTPAVTGSGNVSYCQSSGRLAEVPDFSLTANTEIRAPMGSVTPFVRALFTYRPGFHSDRVNYDYRSRELLNAYFGVRGDEGRWEFSVFAKNLLNQKRITNISLGEAQQSTFCRPGGACIGGGAPLNSGYRLVNVMNPREFGLTGTFKF